MLIITVTILHIIVCIILVLVVLLQSGKGADLASAFGGASSQTAFGSRGPASFLSKMTTIAAVIFMLTSIGLSMISTKAVSKSVLEGTAEETATPDTVKPKTETSDTTGLTQEQIERRIQELEAEKQKKANAGESTPVLKPEAPLNPEESAPAPK